MPIFIVGCSRGGTTLTQSLFVGVDSIEIFPEANVLYHYINELNCRRFGPAMGRLYNIYSLPDKLKTYLGATHKYNTTYIESFLSTIKREDLKSVVLEKTDKLEASYKNFEFVMEKLSGGKCWLEKSPQNVFCIKEIEKYINKPKFIHVIRDGKDNIASLIDAASKYAGFADRFGGKDGLNKAIHYWNAAVKASIANSAKPNHHIIRYEDLASEPEKVANGICEFLGLPLGSLQAEYSTAGIVTDNEPWKSSQKTIQKSKSKFKEVLNEAQQLQVEQNILPIDSYFPCKYA